MTPIEKPGQYPFTRGVYAEMYKKRLWTMRQYAGFTSAQETNKRYRYLLKQGVSGLSVAFDLPTQVGYDSDDPMSMGEVGKVGVPISSIENMEALFDQIPLDQVSTSMTINSTAAILLAMYIVLAERINIPVDSLRGTIQNDILKEYVARGTYIYPPEPSMRLIRDVFEFCDTHVPKWNTISISGYHIREAGSTAAQELAFTIANGIAYVQNAVEAGLDVNRFGTRLSFFFNAHNDFLTEAAKFRAARRLWAKTMKQRFNVTNEKAMLCRFHTQTGGSTLAAQQIDNNVVRTTIQAMSAVLGGTQSLHTNSRDEALSLPTEDAARLALRTQQIIAHESGITEYPDPLAGSYVVEDLTNELEEEAVSILEEIDKIGGAVKAIESGWVQSEIAQSAFLYQKDVDSKKRIVVGVNQFEDSEETAEPSLLKIDQEMVDNHLIELDTFKRKRDSNKVSSTLSELKTAAKTADNLMPFILKCIRSGSTVGEIAQSLREVFGEYHST